MLSPRSRGKGGRRFPGRDGGARKHRPVRWRKQAVHAVEQFPKNVGEVTELTCYWPCLDYTAAEWIYLFDQRIAGTGIPYAPEFHGQVFTVRVPASAAAKVSAIITQIQKR